MTVLTFAVLHVFFCIRTVSAVHAHTGLVLLLFIDFLTSHQHPILVGSFTFLDLKKNLLFVCVLNCVTMNWKLNKQ